MVHHSTVRVAVEGSIPHWPPADRTQRLVVNRDAFCMVVQQLFVRLQPLGFEQVHQDLALPPLRKPFPHHCNQKGVNVRHLCVERQQLQRFRGVDPFRMPRKHPLRSPDVYTLVFRRLQVDLQQRDEDVSCILVLRVVVYLAVLFSLFRIMPALILFIVILHTGWKENRQGKAMMEGRREEGRGEGTGGDVCENSWS